ncbi:hypothetical protein MVEN_01381700 [Mycena venus]|uniref:Uncharacterized protein n=1 Tax=Mycena venus TaxID=2733690 RepID=A0A8H6XYC6_9AGAR|nr:hypothetical protein MVEN_01381700 [Mycena venus]
MFSRRWFTSFMQSQSFSSREISHDTGSGQGDAPHNEVDTVEHSPETTRPYHPADAINKHLLSLSSRGIVTAVTHDDEWISVLREDDETVPAESELLKRICDKYTTRVTSGGAYL